MTPKLLDTDLREVFDDRPLLHRVLSAICIDQDIEYIEALERLHSGADSAYSCSGPNTLGEALTWMKCEPDDVADGVRLLERRDEAVQAAYEEAAGLKLLDEKVNSHGLVMLDTNGGDVSGEQVGTGPGPSMYPSSSVGVPLRRPVPLRADIGTVLTDPAEHERRLARIRKAQRGAWDGDEGRERFRTADRQHAEAGIDLVRTAERPHDLAAAAAKANQLGAQLDQAIEAVGDKRQRLRMLDAEIAKLTGDRKQLQTQGGATALKLLDQMPVGHADATANQLLSDDGIKNEALRLHEATKERLRLLDRGPGEYLRTLEEIMDGATASAPEQPATPPGVDPASHELDQQIRERMRRLGRDETGYLATFEDIIGGAR